jgi:sulfite reductase alpha subunit-like flavoprotein
LAQQNPDESESIPVWFGKGTMKLPQVIPSLGLPPPVIMIGPGTGVAAFRSFIHYLSSKYPLQPKVLVFGCRSEHKDFYYADEWRTYPDLKLITTFSRD